MISKHKKSVKFDTNEEYWRWYEKQEEKRILEDYFKEVKNE